MAEPVQQGDNGKPSGHKKEPIERKRAQRRDRAEAHAADEKKRQPSGDGPLVPKLEEQKHREEDRAGAAEILHRLADAGLAAHNGARVASPVVEVREGRRDDRHE